MYVIGLDWAGLALTAPLYFLLFRDELNVRP